MEARPHSRELLQFDAQQRAVAVEDACRVIADARVFQPKVGIILGSGLGNLVSDVSHATSVPFAEIPYFPLAHAQGHAGQLVMGFLGGVPVVLLQGRSHRYEGFATAEVTFPTEVLHGLGATTLIVTNAAGGLNGRYRAGDLMAIDSHIDLLWQRGQNMRSSSSATSVTPYDAAMIETAQLYARRFDVVMHRGCYVGTLGPTYETRNEYRMFGEFGGDAVGMSTIAEVNAANRLKMNVLAISVITNVASTFVPVTTTHEEVVEAGKAAGPKLMKIVRSILDDMAGQPD